MRIVTIFANDEAEVRLKFSDEFRAMYDIYRADALRDAIAEMTNEYKTTLQRMHLDMCHPSVLGKEQ